LIAGEVEEDGVGLVEGALGREQGEGVVLLVDLLGGEGGVEEVGCDEGLQVVGIGGFGEVEGFGHV
jgi:hypothetical protein